MLGAASLIFGGGALLTHCGSGVGSQSTHSNNSFISSSGMNLMLNGSNFQFVGYNEAGDANEWVNGCMSLPFSQSTLDAEYARFQALGITIVRVFFFQSMAISNGAINYAGFDRLISEAKSHGIRVVAVLVNHPLGSNGSTACEGTPAKYLDWFSQQPGSGNSPLYKTVESGYVLSYRDYVGQVAAHYANEPTIAWWELMNEPAAMTNSTTCQESLSGGIGAAQAIRQWADDMASVIKTNDPNHLIDLGTTGNPNYCGTQSGSYSSSSYCVAVGVSGCTNDYEYAAMGTVSVNGKTLPSIDLLTVHEYSSSYSGSDLLNFYSGITSELSAHLSEANSLNKPLYVGETGLLVTPAASGNGCGGAQENFSGASCTSRSSCMDSKLHTFFSSSPTIAGALVWQATPYQSGLDGDCYSVGYTGGSKGTSNGTIDPVDAILNKHAGGAP